VEDSSQFFSDSIHATKGGATNLKVGREGVNIIEGGGGGNTVKTLKITKGGGA